MDRVDELGYVGHGDFVCVAVEGIQIYSRNQCITQRAWICPKIGFRHAFVSFVPRAPFINNELDLSPGINLAHYGPVIVDERLHAIGFAQQFIPFIRRVLSRDFFSGAAAVVMKPPTIEIAKKVLPFLSQLGEEPACPTPVGAVGTRADEGELYVVARQPGDKLAKLSRIFLRSQIAATAP